MRDSNHRSVLANRPVVTITSTVYDRRALDLSSNVPLINSLNHLTYLTSNSGKVRETIANDGALERLVSILHGCHIPLYELLQLDLKHVSRHRRARMVWRQKNLAMCAWKWTLAFQCLVLTGTRGTEQIRKKVVLSGVMPVLATVLDNYLLYHKNYDHLRGTKVDVDLKSLGTEQNYKDLRKDESETFAQYMEYLTGREDLRLSHDPGFVSEDLLSATGTLPSDFADIWSTFKNLDTENGNSSDENGYSNAEGDDDAMVDKEASDDSCFMVDEDNKLSISIPRDFFLGRIIPKQDDVIWSLQLLAFISKYTYMKQQLQNVELIESLSFRSIVERVKRRINGEAEQMTQSTKSCDDEVSYDIPMQEQEDDPFLVEILGLANRCKQLEKEKELENVVPSRNPYEYYHVLTTEHRFSRRLLEERQLVANFKEKWNYYELDMDLDEATWKHASSKDCHNLFPLVERYTVSSKNPHDMVYWSSVIMRNSCRKNEVTGVRQCANFLCGKWEDFPRQFAKCRRCKRTKYCSRDCQLKAWTYHRYWCHEVGSGMNTAASNTGANTPSSSTASSNAPLPTGNGNIMAINAGTVTGPATGLGVNLRGGTTRATTVVVEEVTGINTGATAGANTASITTNAISNIDRNAGIGNIQRLHNAALDQEDEMITTDDNDNDNFA
ncbi:ZYBA0S03-07008g1_1 [Zygosaccharomyces bailii CLIB 213]|uniref:ZYBA0S03-07008g1_1 n=1 Tax=Zygosaccharomyces bailii (strain CLIB 213 / ATCC 58445 / CBS 680 / BCRC 21525 / NBRC 1098 / NCYC 1416 / NRRL Y-2227) TaxID=1333698 RepID=A0A8J2XA00_ZYGB2|nr:ZYBA0S03-07008g1_1 [Zygosaccharomyces bailii CLIB 213]